MQKGPMVSPALSVMVQVPMDCRVVYCDLSYRSGVMMPHGGGRGDVQTHHGWVKHRRRDSGVEALQARLGRSLFSSLGAKRVHGDSPSLRANGRLVRRQNSCAARRDSGT
jgi:hypothetical protein